MVFKANHVKFAQALHSKNSLAWRVRTTGISKRKMGKTLQASEDNPLIQIQPNIEKWLKEPTERYHYCVKSNKNRRKKKKDSVMKNEHTTREFY